MTEPKRVSIDGHTYQLRPWDFLASHQWLYRIVQKVVEGGIAGRGNGMVIAVMVIQQMEPATYMELNQQAWKYTDLVANADGKTSVVPLVGVVGEHFRARHLQALELLIEHMKMEYGDFFGRVGELVERLVGKAT